MNNYFKSLALTMLGLSSWSVASADIGLLSPKENEVLSEISTLQLAFDTFEVPFTTSAEDVQILNSAGTVVSKSSTVDCDGENWNAYNVTFTPAVTEEGDYVISIPADWFSGMGAAIHRNVKVGEVTYNMNPTFIGIPYSIDNKTEYYQNGAAITGTAENKVKEFRLEFEGKTEVYIKSGYKFELTGGGKSYELTVGGFYNSQDMMFDYVDQTIMTLTLGEELPTGDYTLTIPAGSLLSVDKKSSNDEIVFNFSYTAPEQTGSKDPLVLDEAKRIKIKFKTTGEGENMRVVTDENFNAVLLPDLTHSSDIDVTNGTTEFGTFVDILESGVIPSGQEAIEAADGDGIYIKINHTDAKEVWYTISNSELGENSIIRTGWMKKGENPGEFFIPWSRDYNFLDNGAPYVFAFHAYDMQPDDIRSEYGQGANFSVTGTCEPYRYSDAEFLAINPDPDVYVKREKEDELMTVFYNKPVNVTKVVVAIDQATTSEISRRDITSKGGGKYDAVWYINLDKSFFSVATLSFTVYAETEDGLVVKGNSGQEDESGMMFTYKSVAEAEAVALGHTSNIYPELSKFTVKVRDREFPIMQSWMNEPYLLDSYGNKICGIDHSYGNDGWTEERVSEGSTDVSVYEVGFKLADLAGNPKTITEEGVYTLVFPDGTFTLGTQYDTAIQKEQKFELYVMPHYGVSYTVDSHKVQFPDVEKGRVLTVDVAPAEGWKLVSLMNGGNDVTESVTDGKYTVNGVSASVDLAAKFEYDGVVFTPTGVDDVVSDLNLRAWSDNGTIHLAGLKEGQEVALFTTGGCLMKSMVSEGSDIEIQIEAGVYIITVTEGDKRVAIKVANN